MISLGRCPTPVDGYQSVDQIAAGFRAYGGGADDPAIGTMLPSCGIEAHLGALAVGEERLQNAGQWSGQAFVAAIFRHLNKYLADAMPAVAAGAMQYVANCMEEVQRG